MAQCSCGSTKKVHDHRKKARAYLIRHKEEAKKSDYAQALWTARARKLGFKSFSEAVRGG